VENDRGQAFTLEAFTASLLLIGAITFALQVTAVTPLTASTSSQHIENQQQQLAAGLLDAAVSNESLKEAVLFWDESAGHFQGADPDDGYYSSGGPPTQFGKMLNRTFRDRGLAFNVNIWYVTTTDQLKREPLVNFGSPSDNAVSARRTVVLFDDDTLTSTSDEELPATTSFYANDVSNSGVYNVIRVEVVVWRM
jgi:hypothetical protein